MSREVKLSVGGKEISLNAFTREFITSTVEGMVRALHGTDPKGEITLSIGPAGGRGSAAGSGQGGG